MMTIIKNIFNKLQMPEYVPVKTHEKGYEERKIMPSVWVSTSRDLIMEEGQPIVTKEQRSQAFRKLFNYISGENEGKNKVEMTVPVIRELIPGQGPACETKWTMSFFVPREFSENPPQPTNPGVFITRYPAMTVFVKTFGGYASEDTYMAEMKAFAPVVEGDGHKIRDDVYYFAGYDSPTKLINRRNEVWLVKKEEEKTGEGAAGGLAGAVGATEQQ